MTTNARPGRAARLEELALVDAGDLDALGVHRLEDRAATGPRFPAGARPGALALASAGATPRG